MWWKNNVWFFLINSLWIIMRVFNFIAVFYIKLLPFDYKKKNKVFRVKSKWFFWIIIIRRIILNWNNNKSVLITIIKNKLKYETTFQYFLSFIIFLFEFLYSCGDTFSSKINFDFFFVCACNLCLITKDAFIKRVHQKYF